MMFRLAACCLFPLLLTTLQLGPVLLAAESPPPDVSRTPEAVETVSDKLNVLLLCTGLSTGHVVPVLAVGEELVRRGHNVTLCSTHGPLKEESMRKMAERVGVSFISAGPAADMGGRDMNGLTSAFQREIETMAKLIFDDHENENDIQLTSYNIVLYSDVMMHPVAACSHQRYNIPQIMISTVAQMYLESEPNWPWPNMMLAGDSSDNLSFLERAKLTIFGFMFCLFEQKFASIVYEPVVKYCPDIVVKPPPHPHFPEIYPTTIGFEFSRTIFPLTSYVGPLVSKSPEALPQDLKLWLAGKRDKSVIYVSTGSHMDIDKATGKAIYEGILNSGYDAVWALRKFNQNALKGLEIDTERFYIIEWAPQVTILQHKAIRMAIVHGGFNGIHEALYNGVPLIVIPLLQNSDQFGNAGRVYHQGLGVSLDSKALTAETITNSINEIDSGDYRRNAQRLRKIFLFAGGVEKAADLVEFYSEVGFDHLVPAYAKYKWSWVQYYNVDVYALLVLILVSVVYCSIKCCQCVCRRRCGLGRSGKEKED